MLTAILLLVALFWLVIAIDTWKGLRELPTLDNEPPTAIVGKISVIVAARNEAHTIEKSIRSQLQQTYQSIEWILVNDRSTDGTGIIMEKLARLDSRIHVLHIDNLPAGWLGKNHALYRGYMQSSGSLLVFTDADVHYEPDLLTKAVAFFTRQKLHHLTLSPSLEARSFLLKGFIAYFLFGFSYYKRPWSANREHSKTGIGIGAFNMLDRKTYKIIGTHQAIRMRPDDDLQLGMLVKKHRLKQRLATALPLLKVEWYPSLHEAVKGLEKNTFAGLHYRYSMVLFAIFGVFISQLLPFFTLWHGDPFNQLLSAIIIVLIISIYYPLTKKMTSFLSWHILLFPLSVLLFLYAITRATVLTFLRGGIQWRGTHYPLKELKKRIK
ncbi:glycosyltransferase [Jeotgalibacillus soli]|uniref:4,4'-diaponeurosporenoate glycosyltransferase n=1 Tax=Jeotgalibacillus soli TaxID=889306 RepID=A0A0C2R1U2_9BACL|nr:glycosyltransferase family A protein [Jeotgalibacillus soli]KIL44285.1 glycosyl transferase [Jeotgalibacillus soli]